MKKSVLLIVALCALVIFASGNNVPGYNDYDGSNGYYYDEPGRGGFDDVLENIISFSVLSGYQKSQWVGGLEVTLSYYGIGFIATSIHVVRKINDSDWELVANAPIINREGNDSLRTIDVWADGLMDGDVVYFRLVFYGIGKRFIGISNTVSFIHYEAL